MKNYTLTLHLLIRELEGGALLGEALFFPEISFHESDRRRLIEGIRHRAGEVLKKLPAFVLWRRQSSPQESLPRIEEIELPLQPPKRAVDWLEPVRLKFHVLRWRHDDGTPAAHVVELGIEVLARTETEMEARIPREIKAALQRMEITGSLLRLIGVQRDRVVSLESLVLNVALSTPRQRAEEENRPATEEKSVLAEVATDLTKESSHPVFGREAEVARLAEALGRAPGRSLLLVGPPGTGKTALLREVVRRRAELSLAATPFWTTSGARLVAGMTGFGMWQDRCRKVCREVSHKRAVLHLGNLVELIEVGKSEGNSQGIASFLRPFFERGEVLAVLECTPEQLPLVEKENPHLLAALERMHVKEPTEAVGREILQGVAESEKSRGETLVDESGLETLERLHRRYATYSAWPGRPVRFLRDMLKDRQALRATVQGRRGRRADGGVTPEMIARASRKISGEEVIGAFSRETGLPLFMLDDEVPLDLDETRLWFSGRVIGQEAAVERVASLLATAKTRLSRPKRPLASLLCIGPTGVGKTEMAKALAEYLFGDRGRLVRFDMSEYADSISVTRLIGGLGAKEGLLTARVREQPFCVLLLDELEKAHPAFFDLLLQALGEGRLTDARGQVADFCNAVVVMTSNLGAQSYRQGTVGFLGASGTVDEAGVAAGAELHFTEEVRKFLRPEIFARIDTIVPFSPLGPEIMRAIAARELEQIARRDGIRLRGVDLRIGAGVADHLARVGYDARYGARPLKRMIERELLSPLADALSRAAGDQPLLAEAGLTASGILSIVVTPQAGAGAVVRDARRAAARQETESRLAGEFAELRRQVQRLRSGVAFQEMDNEIFRLETILSKAGEAGETGANDPQVAKLPLLRECRRAVEALATEMEEAEDALLLDIYDRKAFDGEATERRLAQLQERWRRDTTEFYALRQPGRDQIVLGVYGDKASWLHALAAAYHGLAVRRGWRARVYQVPPPQRSADGAQFFVLTPVEAPEPFFARASTHTHGLILAIEGPLVFPLLAAEQGLQVWKGGDDPAPALVDAFAGSAENYTPPNGAGERGKLPDAPRIRIYDPARRFVDDNGLGKLPFPESQELAAFLDDLVTARLDRDLSNLLE